MRTSRAPAPCRSPSIHPLVKRGLLCRHRGEWSAKRKVVVFSLPGRFHPDAPPAQQTTPAAPPATPPVAAPASLALSAKAAPPASPAAAAARAVTPLPDPARSILVLKRLASFFAEDIAAELRRVARFIEEAGNDDD